MNRASGTQGHRYVNAYATRNKTLETKTLDAGRGSGPSRFQNLGQNVGHRSVKCFLTVLSAGSRCQRAIGDRARVRGGRGLPSAVRTG
jgi:hypothetical protein